MFLFISLNWAYVTGHSLVEVDSFLCELAWSVLGVLIRLVLDYLHTFPTFTLLMTVFTDHVQLANPVLKDSRQKTNKHKKDLDIRSIVLFKLGRHLGVDISTLLGYSSETPNGNDTYTLSFNSTAAIKINTEGKIPGLPLSLHDTLEAVGLGAVCSIVTKTSYRVMIGKHNNSNSSTSSQLTAPCDTSVSRHIFH